MGGLTRFAFGAVWSALELAVAAYDFITNRDPDAALHQFLAEHPGVTVYTVDDQPN